MQVQERGSLRVAGRLGPAKAQSREVSGRKYRGQDPGGGLWHLLHGLAHVEGRLQACGAHRPQVGPPSLLPAISLLSTSPVCISTMSAQHPHLTFLQRDLADLQFRDGQFDLVLEKSTLDTLLSDCPDQEEEGSEGTEVVMRGLGEVERVLRPGGVFLSVSLSCPRRRGRLLARLGRLEQEVVEGGEDRVDYSVTSVTVGGSDGEGVVDEGSEEREVLGHTKDEEKKGAGDREMEGEGDEISDEYKLLVQSMIS